MCEAELKAASGQTLATYVPPDVSRFPGDVFSGRRIPIAELEADSKNRVLSGDELSGKSALVHWLSARKNSVRRADSPKLSTVVDYRIIEAGQDIRNTLIRRLAGFGLTAAQAEYVLSIGKLELFFDNFSPHDSNALANFESFFAECPRLRWTVATRGSARYMPSQAPTAFSKDGLTYYQLVETTMPTVLRMIENHEQGKSADSPRAIVDKVFRSINNLRAPRTIFYVQSMVDVFLSNSSVEPLNRYLLIENLLSDRIRSAHREMLPNRPIDMEMLETFIGQIAHLLMKRSDAYLSKGDFYQLVEDFIDRKGIQKKRFDADTILKILNCSFVLREYEPGFGFMMPSVEDYFLAKHMSRDEGFRSLIMSADGLLAYPTVAELYIAQNPSDRPRIEEVLGLLDAFQAEVAPFVDEIRDSAVATIASAHPGGSLQLQDGIIERLGKLENEEDGTPLRFEEPQPVGRTKRIRFATEERGAVFLQLGASILGITRTLDQNERIQIFGRLKGVLLTTIHSLPMIAHHLAEGGEITFRGTSLKADYVGELAVPEDRFYIILRSMIFNLFRNFATWSGSPTFFKAAVRLRAEEEDELVRSALFTQNIEADLADSLDFIPAISTGVDSLILKDILVNTYLDAMTLVPLERADEARAIQRLVEVTFELHPAKSKDEASILKHKDQLSKHFNERIGLNRYLGRLGSAKR